MRYNFLFTFFFVFLNAAVAQNLYNQANAANITNESNSTAGWSGPALIETDNENPHDGSYLILVESGEDGRHAETGFEAVVGQMYDISIWARRGPQSSNPLFDDWSGFSGFVKTNIQGQGWNEYTFLVTVTSEEPKMRVLASKNNSEGKKVYIDAITVSPHSTGGGGGSGGSGGSGSGINYTTDNANLPTVNWQSLNFYSAGSVGIGTAPNSDFRLSVNGTARVKELIVESDWSDFVFEPDYKLPSLKDVSKQIAEHGHLKDVPSAQEISENGVDVGEMNKVLLQKIEELTLYMIKADQKIEKLDLLLTESEKRIEELEKKLKEE